jgi:uncharacterized protein YlzI (FlbEa/FlbD family)
MTQFIELTGNEGKVFINPSQIESIHEDGDNMSMVYGQYADDHAGYLIQESTVEILAKIEAARKSDPAERIAVALETIASEMEITRMIGMKITFPDKDGDK